MRNKSKSTLKVRFWRVLIIGLAGLAIFLALPFVPRGASPGPHVVVIGIDGLSAAAVTPSRTPVIARLLQQGAGTTQARAVLPTMSSANWASHLMGAPPRRHGIRGNDWRRDRWDHVALCDREIGAGWPTVFDLAHDAGLRTAAFYDWIGIGRFIPRADRRQYTHTEWLATWWAIRHLRLSRPNLTFVHLDHVDAAGHAYGFDSAQYFAQVARADAMVARFLTAIERARMRDTLLLVISDHGGIGKIHGGDSDAETLVPWIAYGPQAAMQTLPQVEVTATAPMIAQALGLTPPDCWTGRAPITLSR